MIVIVNGSISNLTINPENATTEDILICSWQPSSDVTQQNVTWYNGSTPYSHDDNIPFSENESRLSSYIAREDETWKCSVTLHNASGDYTYNTSITIKNAYPSPPNATNQTLYEDQTKIIHIGATDPDNDVLHYFILNSSFYCSIDELSGISTCNPNSSHVGTSNVTYYVKDEDPTLVGSEVTYNVLPVNDPPSLSLSDQNATEGVAFNYSFSASDEENNTPFYFSISSNLSSLIIVSYSNVSAYITFNRASHAPLFNETGVWLVSVNVQDSGPTSSTPYDDNSSTGVFVLNISSVNHAPNITSNLSGYSGTQDSLFTMYVNASDLDSNDTLTFNVSSNCSLSNPWTITTIDNSSNATGIINQTLTNDNVVCRWINISVTDSKEVDWEFVFVNVTNLNDPPVIHNISYYYNSNGDNINNLTAVKGRVFNYRVNATDPDSRTYESEVLLFQDNTSMFDINSSSGLISFTPSEYDVGAHLILINVSDDDGLFDTAIMNLTVVNNTPPVLNSIGSFSCAEDSVCSKIITAYDPDPGENLSFHDNSSLFSMQYINESAALINFTPTNADVRNYTINISVSDYYDFYDFEIINLTINNTNDAPFFDQDRDGVPDNISFDNVVENVTISFRINVTDDDLTIGLDNLTFNWSYINQTGNMSSRTNISSYGSDYFVITLSPLTDNIGNQSLNLSVVDSHNASYYQIVNFTVLHKTTDPVINQIKPYRNSSSQPTINSFAPSSWFSNHFVFINSSENDSVVFDAIAVNDSSISGNNLDYYWYYDGSLSTSLLDVVPGFNSSFSVSFGFFDAGNHSVGLIIEDSRYSTAVWNWTVDVDNTNRNPVLVNDLENLSLNTTITYEDYFSYKNNKQYFYDPDDDPNSDGKRGGVFGENETNLTYSIITGSSCSYASFSISGDDLTVTPKEIGTCFLVFNATDNYGASVSSNNVRVAVTNVVQEEVNVPQSSHGGSSKSRPRIVPIPIEEPEEVPVPLEIIVPEQVTTYVNRTIFIPVILKNNWNGSIKDVSVNASAIGYHNSSINATVRLSEDYFPVIDKGSNVSLSVVVENYRDDEPYEVLINATVKDPEYTDTASVLINSMEKSKDDEDDIKSKIQFARDLMNDNPECQELVKLVDKAESAAEQGNVEEASKLVKASVDGCKYLINQKSSVDEQRPKKFFGLLSLAKKNPVQAVVGIVIFLILVVLAVVLIVASKKKDVPI